MPLKVLNPFNKLDINRLTANSAINLSDLLCYANQTLTAGQQLVSLTVAQFVAAIQPTLTNAITPTGVVVDFAGTTAPSGWVFLNGLTIGTPSSNATLRANADTANLYALLWGSYDNTALPIQDSTGAGTTRGASAAADFAANKRLPVPDFQGRVRAGLDAMGSAAASYRLTNAGSGIVGTNQGATGGSQNQTIGVTQLPAHTHNTLVPGQTAASTAAGTDHPTITATASVTSDGGTGGGLPLPTVQPTGVIPVIIKL
jgi:microcystin-dependent protein